MNYLLITEYYYPLNAIIEFYTEYYKTSINEKMNKLETNIDVYHVILRRVIQMANGVLMMLMLLVKQQQNAVNGIVITLHMNKILMKELNLVNKFSKFLNGLSK